MSTPPRLKLINTPPPKEATAFQQPSPTDSSNGFGSQVSLEQIDKKHFLETRLLFLKKRVEEMISSIDKRVSAIENRVERLESSSLEFESILQKIAQSTAQVAKNSSLSTRTNCYER